MVARALRAFRDADGTIFDHVGALHHADFLIFQRLEREARVKAASQKTASRRRR